MNKTEVMECIDNLKVNGQKGIHSEYKDLVSQIKKLSNARAYQYFDGIKSMNQLLIQKLGLKKFTASELLKAGRMFYDGNGAINPCFKDYEYSKLLRMVSFNSVSYLEELQKLGIIISSSMSRNDLVDKIKEYNIKRWMDSRK